ncbi:acyltransferase [Nocardioides sp. LMS-CY]|uniref:acyltransferase family protein n=1 Tax=Nocardioides sp. (strain LMS-CY) TaxID=2840457 RepID=UPI001C006D0F|nr:acyltransferase family protein [Nocardioides sp. LMS-CY]QWF21490.1 acyltransferase [Nocardioides sp. LMS-CY]
MTWRYRPELDGLRFLAVYTIILYHAQSGWVPGGFVSLDLFFVLSGFLVLNVVLAEIDERGRLSLLGFYARRVRRLLPAAVLAIVLISLVFVLTASLPERLPLVRDAQSALLYVANWHFIAAANDYFATGTDKSPFLHFWSLSLEEQFYFVFPLLVVLMVRLGWQHRKRFLAVLVALMLASLAAQIAFARVDVNRAYYGTDTRLYQLLAGAVLALAVRHYWRPPPAGSESGPGSSRRWSLLGLAGIGSLLVLVIGVPDVSVSTRGILATVASVAAILGLYAAPLSWPARLLGGQVPAYLGQISYGTYLYHWPVILVLLQFLDVRPSVLALLTAGIASGLAALSFQVFESPIRRSRWLSPRRRTTVVSGLAVSVAIAVVVVPPVLRSERTPAVQAVGGPLAVDSSPELRSALERRVPDLDYEKVAADRGPADTWCTPDDLDGCLLVPGEGRHVVLVGDSQARMLAPAFRRLAEKRGFRLSIDIVSSCPWQDGLYNAWASDQNQEQCHEARDDFYRETLPQMEPDLVVVASLARSADRWQGHVVDRDGEAGDLHQMQLEATERTADLVRDAGAPLVMVHSIIGAGGYDGEGRHPLDCLARATTLGDCVVPHPVERPTVDSFYDTVAAPRADVATIDLNPVVCPDAPSCLPMLGGAVVWRDQNHLTGTLTTRVRGQIWRAIEDTGLLEE